MTITQRPSGFNSVHLPIIYKITNDRWPVNTFDTVRTVSSFTNDAGYCKLALSGDIKTSGTANELEFVKVTVDGVDEIVQIYTYYSDTSITVDIPYDAGIVFGNIQYYYANYHNRFKIYAGLRGAHTLNANKPYQLLTSIKAVPDSTGETVININEILKSDISILDNDTTYTQNDITSFTEFYIEYAEAYDYSADGYTLTSYVSSYSSDSANYAIAVNSKLPFKNGYGGVMTEYVGSSQKFLTLFSNPVLFNGFYYELWFLRQSGDTKDLRVRRYTNGVLGATDTINVDNKDEGIYRVQITNTGLEDTLLVDLYESGVLSETKTISVNSECNNQDIYLAWKNYLWGMDYWLFTGEKDYSIDIESTKSSEKNIFINWPNSWDADSVTYETQRNSRESIVVRSQNLTLDQVNAIKYIRTSPLVQIYGDRTVIVDQDSFMVYSEADKIYSISFKITYTNQIPSQSL